MDLTQLIILAIIQGLTEFLPVSSSAHLILLPLLTEWRDQGLTIDVAAHVGSLCAVMVYFRGDLSRILRAGGESIRRRDMASREARLFWLLSGASLPVLIAGFLLRDVVAVYLRDPLIIALASIGFGLLLWFADLRGKRARRLAAIGPRDALAIGLAQALALIPGVSRSGITMTAALMLGFDRQSAARFSFLLAIPILLAAGGYEALKLTRAAGGVDATHFLVALLLSALSALLAIHCFLKIVEKIGLLPFVIYRIALGVILLLFFI